MVDSKKGLGLACTFRYGGGGGGGGGGCHGDMSTKQWSKVRTFDLPLSTVCTEFLCTELDRNKRYEVMGLQECIGR